MLGHEFATGQTTYMMRQAITTRDHDFEILRHADRSDDGIHENTISMTMIWMITQKNALERGTSSLSPSRASTSV